MTDKINDMFAIGPLVEPGVAEKMVGSKELLPNTTTQPPTFEETLADFNIARQNVLNVIDTSRDAIAKVAGIADAAQDTEWYDSLTSALKVMLEANRDLVDMQVKIHKLTENLGGAIQRVQNNLFVGSTADLQKFLAENLRDKPK